MERGEVCFDLVVGVVFVFDLVVDAGDFLYRHRTSSALDEPRDVIAIGSTAECVIPCEGSLLSPPMACLPDIWFYSNGTTSDTAPRTLALSISNDRYHCHPRIPTDYH